MSGLTLPCDTDFSPHPHGSTCLNTCMCVLGALSSGPPGPPVTVLVWWMQNQQRLQGQAGVQAPARQGEPRPKRRASEPGTPSASPAQVQLEVAQQAWGDRMRAALVQAQLACIDAQQAAAWAEDRMIGSALLGHHVVSVGRDAAACLLLAHTRCMLLTPTHRGVPTAIACDLLVSFRRPCMLPVTPILLHARGMVQNSGRK